LSLPAITVIIVEDEAITAMFMEIKLRSSGFNVLKRVSSGEDAVEYAVKLKPDLVLMDIRLAGIMDGIEAVTKIKEKSDKNIQFIFTTGYSDKDLTERSSKLKPAGFFVKPVNMNVLASIIRQLFSGQDNLPQVNE
jgi:DNA-binding NarL/FixJ family response regulator